MLVTLVVLFTTSHDILGDVRIAIVAEEFGHGVGATALCRRYVACNVLVVG